MEEMYNSYLFNYNALVALDMHIMKNEEFCEICLFPLTNRYELAKEKLPFWSLVKPRKSPFYLEGVDYRELFDVSRDKYEKAFVEGIERPALFELFERWFEEHLKLLERKKIMILTYDWPIKKKLLLDWMGEKNFEYYFHFHVRDILPIALFFNDWAQFNLDRPTFQKVDFAYIANSAKAKHAINDCLMNAAGIVEIYQYMSKKMAKIIP